MCGIIGFVGRESVNDLEMMLDMIEHRGRDDRVVWHDNEVSLGMNRLAIIDLKKGLYPMTYKHYVLVYNGEIYNFKYLRNRLSKMGVKFVTESDAEVILPLYDLYGTRAFEMIEGMFAVSIFDNRERKLVLARDKSGEKMIYYALSGKEFVFGSELKVVMQSGIVKRKLNTEVLGEYLIRGSVSSEETLVDGVKKLLPAECLVYSLKSRRASKSKYWQPKIKTDQELGPFKSKVDRLDNLVKEAVKSRMISDVPVGAFLSGGVDSSLVTYWALKHNSKLKTFSVIFPDSAWYNEGRYSRKVASYLGTEHNEIECTAKSVRPVMERIGELIDEPIVDPAVLPTFLLSRLARESLPVVLTGEGADELFGGYYRYQKQLMELRLRGIIEKVPLLRQMRNEFCPHRMRRLFDQFEGQYSSLRVWSADELKELLHGEVGLQVESEEFRNIMAKDPLLGMQIYDYRSYLGSQLLMKVDKFTMINNLEARAPYLDSKVIDLAFRLSERDKIRGIHGKYILRKVAERYLPKEIAWRVKRGFSLPLGKWFRTDYRDLVEQGIEILGSYRSIFNLGVYREIVAEHMAMKGEKDYRDKIWAMTVLALWMNHYKVGE